MASRVFPTPEHVRITKVKALVVDHGAQGEFRSSLRMAEVEEPTVGPGQVMVRVYASSLNRADLLIRAGKHSLATGNSERMVAGLDAAGEIIAIADDVSSVCIGDRVMAKVDGGLAERVVVDATMAVPIPERWSYQEGAASVLGLLTAHNALVTAGRFTEGDTVLVHAATSGVATQAIQMARHFGAGLVVATTRSNQWEKEIKSLGADELIVSGHAQFASRVLALTDGRGTNIVLDHVGGPYLDENIKALGIGGRLVGIGRLGGTQAALNLEEVARKRLEIIGVTFRTRTSQESSQVVSALLEDIDLVGGADTLRPVIHSLYPWTEALEAHEALARNQHFGKLVLTLHGEN